MNPVIAKKIAAVAAAIEPMKKLAENEAGWNFVSIDQYYERVPPICLENGLWWKAVETGFSSDSNADGEYFNFTYAVTLIDLEYGFEEYYGDFTIPHPVQGAQTAGSAASYCDKAVMRLLFKVVTGEPDADHFAKGRGNKSNVKVTSPFSKDKDKDDVDRGEDTPETVEPKKRGRKPATDKAAGEPPQEVEETPGDEEPEFVDGHDEYAKISAKLLKALAECDSAAKLDQFRVDYEKDVSRLKKDAENDELKGNSQKWAIAAKNVVAAKFRELFDKYN